MPYSICLYILRCLVYPVHIINAQVKCCNIVLCIDSEPISLNYSYYSYRTTINCVINVMINIIKKEKNYIARQFLCHNNKIMTKSCNGYIYIYIYFFVSRSALQL